MLHYGTNLNLWHRIWETKSQKPQKKSHGCTGNQCVRSVTEALKKRSVVLHRAEGKEGVAPWASGYKEWKIRLLPWLETRKDAAESSLWTPVSDKTDSKLCWTNLILCPWLLKRFFQWNFLPRFVMFCKLFSEMDSGKCTDMLQELSSLSDTFITAEKCSSGKYFIRFGWRVEPEVACRRQDRNVIKHAHLLTGQLPALFTRRPNWTLHRLCTRELAGAKSV